MMSVITPVSNKTARQNKEITQQNSLTRLKICLKMRKSSTIQNVQIFFISSATSVKNIASHTLLFKIYISKIFTVILAVYAAFSDKANAAKF